ncbi:MAG: S8 family serine peptidase [Caldilineaceae bacterium]
MNIRPQLYLSLCLSIFIVLCVTGVGALTASSLSVVYAAVTVAQPSAQGAGAPAAVQSNDWDEARWRQWQTFAPELQAKVDPRILAELHGAVIPAHLGDVAVQPALLPQTLVPLEKTRFLVYLKQQPDFTQLQSMVFASQAAERTAVFQLLRSNAQEQQASLRAFLDTRQRSQDVVSYQPFYIVNAFAVEGGLETIMALAARADVARLIANYPLVKQWEEPAALMNSLNSLATIPASNASALRQSSQLDPENWNITLVQADRVWRELGVRGEGAVVAGFDTGVSYKHPALAKQYRGYLGNGQYNHNYNWFEPDSKLYPGGNLGASVSLEPTSCDAHGTHTMGTSVGDGEEDGTQIGMAPGAKWIAIPGICYNTMGGGIRDDIGGLKAFQWLLCPTDLSGDLATSDCSKAPDVVNDSWGSANPVNDVLRPALQALRAMNIAPVFAAGNPSAGPGSIGTPANAPEAITVGATDFNDQVAYFSGRGPSFYEGEQKPELSAPGVEVLSSVGNSSYLYASGTSMAAPHVTGLIALMISADLQDGVRDFSVDELEQFMQYTAVDLGEPGPDNDYGYGRINAYEAVRWVLSAGDLRGAVRSNVGNTAIAQATIVGSGGGSSFTTQSGATGLYSVTVPGGFYNVTVSAWGYYSHTFANQAVFAGSLSVVDFALAPLPTALLQGTIRSNGAAVADARVYLQEWPDAVAQSNASGQYTMTLPVGTHTLVVEKNGHRVAKAQFTIGGAGATQDLALESAPTILLVEADAYRGWFEGWPVGNIFTWAMDQQGYLYERWPIRYLTITDTETLDDGSVGYGIPSATTLEKYGLVIWVQSGCDSGYFGCYYYSSPTAFGADDNLEAYMDSGGRLILSGQDLGSWESGSTFYEDYLHTERVLNSAAREGDTLTGVSFLENLALTLTNASLYGYRNGVVALSPDAIAPLADDATAYPILLYDDAQAPAALAIDACNANYRAVYFGVGFENIGPRADNRDPMIAEALGRSIRWSQGEKQAADLELLVEQTKAILAPGRTALYPVQLSNTGHNALDIQLTAANATWATQILSGTEELSGPLHLAPCQAVKLTVAVAVPTDVLNGATATVQLTAQAIGNTALTRQKSLTTEAFAEWQVEENLPTSRYQLGVVGMPAKGYLYAIGGWNNVLGGDEDPYIFDYASSVTERYNPCTELWEPMADLPAPRANAGVGVLNDKIYVVGGNSLSYDYGYYDVWQYATVFVYDPNANSWSEMAPLPSAYSGMAVAAANGKLFAFGGYDDQGFSSADTYMYDPATNTWSKRAPMPGGGRYYAAAATLNGKIYVAGGYSGLDLLEIYDPGTNTWETAASMESARYAFGLAAAPDGYLYAVGGTTNYYATANVERYDPVADEWNEMSGLNDQARAGVGAAFISGRIYAVGGAGVLRSTEALQVETAFCLSNLTTPQNVVGIGGTISYTVSLHAARTALPQAAFVAPLPPSTSFVGFEANEAGASYNSAKRQIEWQGAIAAHAAPQNVTYVVATDAATITDGDFITSSIVFRSGAGLVFTRTTGSLVIAPDLSQSSKTVDQKAALGNSVLTYTIQLQGRTFVGGPVQVADPLPSGIEYIPGTLHYSDGDGHYDPAQRTIFWTGRTQSGADAFLNFSDDYVWGDTDGRGEAPSVQYDWVNISDTGVSLLGGDALYYCDLPIGFDFPFYDQTEHEFCISTNGFISFDPQGYADDSNDCPLPYAYGNSALIAALWDDLYVSGKIHYQTLGVAPNRYLVVQWNNVRSYSSLSDRTADFQIVLFENGVIRVAIEQAGTLTGGSSTTGLENRDGTLGATYACNQPNTLHDRLAVVFIPPGVSTGAAHADIQFQVRSATNLAVNQTITNTAIITATDDVLRRQATALFNSVNLKSSLVRLDKAEIVPGETVVYSVTLRNTGLFTAPNAALSLPIPAAMAYVDNTITCTTGTCQQAAGVIRWSGVLAPRADVTVRFGLKLVTGLPDRTPVKSAVELEDGFGNHYQLPVTVMARRSNLGFSQLQFVPAYAEPGSTVSIAIYARNTGMLATTSKAQMTLPAGFTYVDGSLACGTGLCSYNAGTIQWVGALAARSVVMVQFLVKLPPTATYGDTFDATAMVDDMDWVEQYVLKATLTVAHNMYLPFANGTGSPPTILYLPLMSVE